jgi:hypothetical protein
VPEQYLYVIAAHPEGPVKLGMSANPEKRLRQLQTGHAEPLSLFHVEPIEAARCRLFERLLHRDIGCHRKQGEWFALTTEAAILQVKFTVIQYDLKDDRELKRKLAGRLPAMVGIVD